MFGLMNYKSKREFGEGGSSLPVCRFLGELDEIAHSHIVSYNQAMGRMVSTHRSGCPIMWYTVRVPAVPGTDWLRRR